ncbi:antimicrobial peptide NK-lysin-like [Cyprinodon tularosa]|uniref:antimicrobial peptide NK-lysin-like n=1 Tax=Cyprinodon tularosa TaxID=77115 RepID=UPI0018E24D5F|nr:antimicrobial peptide NK-lysin-like [Cyprinodon tularosa]
MKTFSFFFLCIIFMAGSVWVVQGRGLEVRIDDTELEEPVLEQQGIPGLCWACKWALNKLKKSLSQNATAEAIKAKLKAVCKGAGFLKSKCNKFVEKQLGVLVEELTTTDDVKTICINTGACKSKEPLDLIFFTNREPQRIKISELP